MMDSKGVRAHMAMQRFWDQKFVVFGVQAHKDAKVREIPRV